VDEVGGIDVVAHGVADEPQSGKGSLGRLADEPGPPPDGHHLWQRPTALLTLCVEGAQARDECAWIAAAVRVVMPNERPAASFVRLVLFHARDHGPFVACP
jgi:hypothetical protein